MLTYAHGCTCIYTDTTPKSNIQFCKTHKVRDHYYGVVFLLQLIPNVYLIRVRAFLHERKYGQNTVKFNNHS